jgi:hypothetical protein
MGASERRRTTSWENTALSLVSRVLAGRGLERYITGEGYESTPVQGLATVAVVGVLLGALWAAGVLRGRRRR